MKKEDNILEQMFLAYKQSKKKKTKNVEKVSDSIMKGRIRLYQFAGIAEIIVPYTNAEIASLWIINEDCQRTCSNYLGEINNKYHQSKQPS